MNLNMIQIDQTLCTGCQECTKVCPTYAIEGEPNKPQTIQQSRCVMCGQCVQKCKACISIGDRGYAQKRAERGLPDTVREPLFAAHNICQLAKVDEALQQDDLINIVHIAPAVRVALAEEFGMPLGSLTVGKLAAALRRLGFSRVYDTNYAADLTIMEEGHELVDRIKRGDKLPMFTSCCPAWIRFVENRYPQFKQNLSTCKSPQQMEGAIIKTYGAKKEGLNPSKIFNVSVMPCTCKAYESDREEMYSSGYKDIDVVITTRELGYLIKSRGIDFCNLEDEPFDRLLGNYTGAGALFGITGGVMEAAIRTVHTLLTGESAVQLEVCEVRGTNGIRIKTMRIGELELHIGVVCDLKNAEQVLDDIESGKLKLHFLEFMTCPQGCVSGGGQPKMLLDEDAPRAYAARREALLEHDRDMLIRESHKNPEICALYDNFLDKPGSKLAHKFLHTILP